MFERVVLGQETFWAAVYDPFMKRDLNRAQVKALIKKGLVDCGGSYQDLLKLVRVPMTDYQRFMDFLRHQNLKP